MDWLCASEWMVPERPSRVNAAAKGILKIALPYKGPAQDAPERSAAGTGIGAAARSAMRT